VNFHDLPLLEDTDVDDMDGRDATDAEGDGLLLVTDVPCFSWVLGAVDLGLV
jgi:hypothetical protein